MQNQSSPTPYVPPTKNDWDILFQPMIDEYFNPPQSVFDNDPFLDILTYEPSSQESSSNVRPANPPFEHISKWKKIHPLENVIGNLIDLSQHENSYNMMPCGVSLMPFLSLPLTKTSSEICIYCTWIL
ncbi:hypothetical protein Tco_0122865 [Tanacetum coccineum]